MKRRLMPSQPLRLAMTIQDLRDWTAKRMEMCGGCCEICRRPFGDTVKTRPNVDHDHKTGRPRAILCAGCNWMEGHLYGDTLEARVAHLTRMIEWLKQQEIDAASWKPTVIWDPTKPFASVRRTPDGRVETLDGLPLVKRNDLPFILQELPRFQPCTIQEFLGHLGHATHVGGGSTKIHDRMIIAFRSGRMQRKLIRDDDGRHVVASAAKATE